MTTSETPETPETPQEPAASEPKRYYVTAEGKVVAEGDPDAVRLIHVEGDELNPEQLAEYGENVADELQAAIEGKAVSEPPENKAETRPARGAEPAA